MSTIRVNKLSPNNSGEIEITGGSVLGIPGTDPYHFATVGQIPAITGVSGISDIFVKNLLAAGVSGAVELAKTHSDNSDQQQTTFIKQYTNYLRKEIFDRIPETIALKTHGTIQRKVKTFNYIGNDNATRVENLPVQFWGRGFSGYHGIEINITPKAANSVCYLSASGFVSIGVTGTTNTYGIGGGAANTFYAVIGKGTTSSTGATSGDYKGLNYRRVVLGIDFAVKPPTGYTGISAGVPPYSNPAFGLSGNGLYQIGNNDLALKAGANIWNLTIRGNSFNISGYDLEPVEQGTQVKYFFLIPIGFPGRTTYNQPETITGSRMKYCTFMVDEIGFTGSVSTRLGAYGDAGIRDITPKNPPTTQEFGVE